MDGERAFNILWKPLLSAKIGDHYPALPALWLSSRMNREKSTKAEEKGCLTGGYQSLIQAAVALYHWGNGNRAGAARLFHSGRRYMGPFRPAFRGLDVDAFWRQVEDALAGALAEGAPANRDREGAGGLESTPPRSRSGFAGTHPSPDSRPRIALDPPPARWPDPDEVRHE